MVTHLEEERVTQPHSHDTEREVVVTDRSGGGMGMILGVIVAILALIFLVWLFLGMGDDGGEAADVIPDDVNVTVDINEG